MRQWVVRSNRLRRRKTQHRDWLGKQPSTIDWRCHRWSLGCHPYRGRKSLVLQHQEDGKCTIPMKRCPYRLDNGSGALSAIPGGEPHNRQPFRCVTQTLPQLPVWSFVADCPVGQSVLRRQVVFHPRKSN